jgi:hypothetical protein
VLNNHTKQLRSKNSAQFYVVRPIHAAPAIPAYHVPSKAICVHMAAQRTNDRESRQTESTIAFSTQFKSRQKVPMTQRSGAGGGERFLRSCWAGEGLWTCQEGQMGQKMVCFAGLSGTRSRQGESKEVHEVGSKRPSSGCNGVHVLSLYPLIWRSLESPVATCSRCCGVLLAVSSVGYVGRVCSRYLSIHGTKRPR